MPLLKSTYHPSFFFKYTHINTVFRTLFSRSSINYERYRLNLPDNDFIDLDFKKEHSSTLVVSIHGLEGSSQSKYMIALGNYLAKQQTDYVAVNLRSCSGEPNKLLSSYHSGKTEDLEAILRFINTEYDYKNIVLVGYSLGANMILKYLGEENRNTTNIKCGIAISAPCDLKGTATVLNQKQNSVYLKRFLKSLKTKAAQKEKQFSNTIIDFNRIKDIHTLKEYDDLYTAPAHGFKNAEDYWKKCSSYPFLPTIKKPTLIVNALDDTFLSSSCYPYETAQKSDYLFLETPKFGGHVGFNSYTLGKNKFWLEKRIFNFITNTLN